jgi:hypothetical protein
MDGTSAAHSLCRTDQVRGGGSPVSPSRHSASTHRVRLVPRGKQRIRGPQKIVLATEVLSEGAYDVWQALKMRSVVHKVIDADGGEAEYRLARVGRSDLRKDTGLNRKTVRLALKKLNERHLISLFEQGDAYTNKTETYRLHDPSSAAARLREEDGAVSWRRVGRGRVLQKAASTSKTPPSDDSTK